MAMLWASCRTAYGKGSPGDRRGLCDTVRGSAAECHDTHHPPVGSPGQLGLHCKPRPTTTTRMVREDRGAAVEFTQHRSTRWVSRRTVAPSETDPDLPDCVQKEMQGTGSGCRPGRSWGADVTLSRMTLPPSRTPLKRPGSIERKTVLQAASRVCPGTVNRCQTVP